MVTEHEIRRIARGLVREHGPDKTATVLGVSRMTALSLAAGAYVRPATIAGVREHLAAREQDPRTFGEAEVK